MNQNPDWLQECINAKDRWQARYAFKGLYDAFMSRYKEDDYKGISEIMASLLKHGNTMQPMLLIANLRLTWLFSPRIERWAEMRDETKRIFDSRDLDSEALLRGLFFQWKTGNI